MELTSSWLWGTQEIFQKKVNLYERLEKEERNGVYSFHQEEADFCCDSILERLF